MFDATRAVDEAKNCTDTSFFIQSKSIELYQLYTDSLKGSFDKDYVQKCRNAYRYESFTVAHRVSEYHYTLYYYDQAGNLAKTVPPAGVHANRDATWLSNVKLNRKERMNLTLRTHLKRLIRRGICFSRSAVMLDACLKLYMGQKFIQGSMSE